MEPFNNDDGEIMVPSVPVHVYTSPMECGDKGNKEDSYLPRCFYLS